MAADDDMGEPSLKTSRSLRNGIRKRLPVVEAVIVPR